MSDFDGSRKHQNNPACTKCIRAFRGLKLDNIRKKKNSDISTSTDNPDFCQTASRTGMCYLLSGSTLATLPQECQFAISVVACEVVDVVGCVVVAVSVRSDVSAGPLVQEDLRWHCQHELGFFVEAPQPLCRKATSVSTTLYKHLNHFVQKHQASQPLCRKTSTSQHFVGKLQVSQPLGRKASGILNHFAEKRQAPQPLCRKESTTSTTL